MELEERVVLDAEFHEMKGVLKVLRRIVGWKAELMEQVKDLQKRTENGYAD
jgi:hypothetical protein